MRGIGAVGAAMGIGAVGAGAAATGAAAGSLGRDEPAAAGVRLP
jgi:hypothetical protein